MHVGLLVSVLLHAALLGWTVISIQSTPELRAPAIEALAVDLITPSELTRLTKGNRDAKLKEALPKESPQSDPTPKEAQRPRPIVAAPPPPPPPAPEPPAPPQASEPPPPAVPAAAPPPAPEPAQPDKAALEQKIADLAALQQVEEAKRRAEAKAKADAEAEARAKEAEAKTRAEAEAKERAEADARAKAEAKAKAEAEAKRKAALKRKQEQDQKRRADAERRRLAEKEKSKLSIDRLSEMLDKSPDQRAPAPAAPEPKSDTRAKGPVLGAKEGRDTTISTSEIDFIGSLIKASVERCYNIVPGRESATLPVVKIIVRLHPDGSLAEQPRIASSGSGSPVYRDAVDAAVRAIVQCAPYLLPADKYEIWGHISLNFDLARMR